MTRYSTCCLINLYAKQYPCRPRERFPHIRHTSLELVLLPHRGLGFLSVRAFTYYLLFSAFYFIANSTTKNPKNTCIFYCLLIILLTNTFSSSWVRQPFLTERYYNLSLALESHHKASGKNRTFLVDWHRRSNGVAAFLLCRNNIHTIIDNSFRYSP